MTHPLSHLAPADRHQAEFDDAVRIAIIQRDRWIDYPRAAQARERLNRLLATPQRERMPCMVLYGESNIGKTLIIRRFMRDHPNAFDAAAGVERIPVLVMQMPPTPEQHRFYAALLFELGAPFAPTARLSVLEGLARGLLRRVAPRLLVDEGHHLLAGSYREQRASLNLLKYLANDLLLVTARKRGYSTTKHPRERRGLRSPMGPCQASRPVVSGHFGAFEPVNGPGKRGRDEIHGISTSHGRDAGTGTDSANCQPLRGKYPRFSVAIHTCGCASCWSERAMRPSRYRAIPR
jgi:hypothetical protein